MHQILIAGAGIIGKTVATWLDSCGDYVVHLADINPPQDLKHTSIQCVKMDINDHDTLRQYIQQHQIQAIGATLPFFQLQQLATLITELQLHYFDVTEDTEVAATVAELTANSPCAFVPQCGLAPGYIDIIANHYIQEFDQVCTVKLRCGALPRHSANALHYAFIWSVDGLINEYINPCQILHNKQLTEVPALSGLENIEIDGNSYEAFHTSGGLASLAETYKDKIEHMDYKTIRYQGHAEKMHFLIHDLKLKNDRENLIKILTNALPYTTDDVVLVYVSVNGQINGRLTTKGFTQKYYPQKVFGMQCSAIQLTTSAGLCTVIDTVLNNPSQYQGFIKQEQFKLSDFYLNRFGKLLAPVATKESA